ncbi:MAG: hypothetical protein GQ534_06125 [Candidatus Delongbacteria bacterium]|nr:hypothetical protein [Candidatus Delongbacteria bacterium]
MKTFIKVLIVLGILAIVVMLGTNYFISRIFQRDAIVKVVEENLNTRFDLKDVSVNIFSTSPSIKLKDIKFAPRDKYADDQIDADDRPEITSEFVYLSELKLNIDIAHLFQSGNEVISEIVIGKGSSISDAKTLDKLRSSLAVLSKTGFDLDILSGKIELQDDVEVKTLFVDGKISFLEDLNLEATDYDLALAKDSWFDIEDNSHKFHGNFLLSKEESEKILENIDKYIDEKTSKATDNGYSVDKNNIKDKLLSGLVKDDRIIIDFISEGNINDPNVSLSSAPESLEKIVEDAVKEALK